MLQEFGPSLWLAEGPTVSFFGFPYPTRMALARLGDGTVWAWSPVALTPELERAVDALGPLRHVVSPNKIHHLFLAEWAARWPEARFHAPPGLAKRKPGLRFDAELSDAADPAWGGEIEPVVFRGSLAIEEVVFVHRPSQTALVGDLVQRLDPAHAKGWKGAVLRWNALVGEHGSTPREWRLTFLRREPARRARERLLALAPERLLVAHGACAREGATGILERALAWI